MRVRSSASASRKSSTCCSFISFRRKMFQPSGGVNPCGRVPRMTRHLNVPMTSTMPRRHSSRIVASISFRPSSSSTTARFFSFKMRRSSGSDGGASSPAQLLTISPISTSSESIGE